MEAPLAHDGLLSPRQIEGLTAVAALCGGRATDALSRLVGGWTITLGASRVAQAPGDDLSAACGGPEARGAAASVDVHGAVSGRIALLWSLSDARFLAAQLLRLDVRRADRLAEDERQVLCETANILGSAGLTALSSMLRVTLLPSVPRLEEGAAGALIQELLGGANSGARALVLETGYRVPGERGFSGSILFAPDAAGLRALLAAIGLWDGGTPEP